MEYTCGQLMMKVKKARYDGDVSMILAEGGQSIRRDEGVVGRANWNLIRISGVICPQEIVKRGIQHGSFSHNPELWII